MPQQASKQADLALTLAPSAPRPFFLQRLFVFFFATHAQSFAAFL